MTSLNRIVTTPLPTTAASGKKKNQQTNSKHINKLTKNRQIDRHTHTHTHARTHARTHTHTHTKRVRASSADLRGARTHLLLVGTVQVRRAGRTDRRTTKDDNNDNNTRFSKALCIHAGYTCEAQNAKHMKHYKVHNIM